VSMELVLVIWHDAHSVGETWMTLEDIDGDPCIVQTVGFLIPDSKPDHVVVAQSHNTHDGFDSVLAIPVGMVKQLKILG
jgi:hypothetical protein